MGRQINHASSAPFASTATAGTYVGQKADGVFTFRGIQYAEPPVGPLRFSPPIDVEPSDQPIDALDFGPIAIQDIDPLPMALPPTEHNYYASGATASEDCLSLNIWTPDISGRAPVLVWIHGGAFAFGSGSGAWTDGARLARDHGIVVVTLNYRLGFLGGLYLADHDPALANLALQDQASALRWVHDNITSFGGDPDTVTIGGQSAGAMSVASLTVAPVARGLFRRAAIISGHLGATIPRDVARAATADALDRLGVDQNGDVLAQLRDLSIFRIMEVQRRIGVSVALFPLVADGVILPEDPMEALMGRSDIDVLIGTTAEEDRLFAVTGLSKSTGSVETALARYLCDPEQAANALALYTPLIGTLNGDNAGALHTIATEHGWTEPARRYATVHSAGGGRSFHYAFTYPSTALAGRLGAAHLVDLPFFFGNLEAPGVSSFLGDAVDTPEAQQLAQGMCAAFAKFVRSGDPSGPVGRWPPYRPDARSTMVLGATSQVEADRLTERLDFWEAQSATAARPLSTFNTTE